MKVLRIVLATIIILVSLVSFADDQAILTVTGNISKTNQPNKKSFIFSFNELNQLPRTVVRTKTIWTSTSDFTGPLIRDILSYVGVNSSAKAVEVRTIDNFVVTIPISDFNRWEVVLAYSRDGQRLKTKTKGPLWIIYPVDKYKTELNINQTRPKFAWGVKDIVVK